MSASKHGGMFSIILTGICPCYSIVCSAALVSYEVVTRFHISCIIEDLCIKMKCYCSDIKVRRCFFLRCTDGTDGLRQHDKAIIYLTLWLCHRLLPKMIYVPGLVAQIQIMCEGFTDRFNDHMMHKEEMGYSFMHTTPSFGV